MKKYNREELTTSIVEKILLALVLFGLATFSFHQMFFNTEEPEDITKSCNIL